MTHKGWSEAARKASLEARRRHTKANMPAGPPKDPFAPGFGAGMTHTEVLQAQENAKSAARAEAAKTAPPVAGNMLEQMRAKVQANATKPPTASERLKKVAAMYGRNSAQYRQAKKTLFGRH